MNGIDEAGEGVMFDLFDMDISKVSFDWDDEKDRLNFFKHGIHFKTAARVFLDPHLLIREDREHPSEARYDVLGKVEKVLFVVCTLREESTIRLISARTATKAEKVWYEHGEDFDE